MRDGKTAPTVWFDIEDLFHFAERNARPTGIQRVCHEIYRAALADPALSCRIGFVRHDTAARGFVEADWDRLAARFRQVTERPAEPARVRAEPPVPQPALPTDRTANPAGVSRRRPLPVRLLKQAVGLVPPRLARPAVLFAVMQSQAAAALAATVGLTVADRARWGARRGAALGGGLRLRRADARSGLATSDRPYGDAAIEPAPRALSEIARRGDVLAVLGSPWFETDYAELAAHARGRLGLRIAVLMHDVIPVRRPEWVDRGTVRVYRDWYRTMLPLADLVFSNSRATASDVQRWCARDNVPLQGPVRPLPIGTGFGGPQQDAPSAGLPASLARVLSGRPYVLFVSTVEARKNHLLLFRVWRRLIEALGPDQVPDLVFAGKVGWMVADLMSQIENSRNLDGKLHVIEGLDDRELRSVYQGCLFTVFPSFYEGWGLPVSESLAMGKPCVCSNATALPEAGGTLARYFDPFDVEDATRVIRATIEDRPALETWTEQVCREFRPVGWNETVSAMLAEIDRPG